MSKPVLALLALLVFALCMAIAVTASATGCYLAWNYAAADALRLPHVTYGTAWIGTLLLCAPIAPVTVLGKLASGSRD